MGILNGSEMQEISPTYYRDHFWQVVDGVESRHGFLLAENESAYIKTLRALSTEAVSLYIRLANRKGPFFRVNKLKYNDIADLGTAIAELQNQNLVISLRLGNQIHSEIFNCFNQKEIYSLLKGYTFKRFSKKAELHDWLNSWDDCHNWLEQILNHEPIIHLCPQDLWPFFKFLFFGELTDNLSGFVVRELGHIVNVELKNTELKPLFNARQEAEDAYRLANIYSEFRARREQQTALKIYQWWQSQGISRDNLSGIALYFFDRLIGRLGRLLEREDEIEAAMMLYQLSPVAPSRERLARLYIKFGELENAKMLLRQMQTSYDGEEVYIASQLLARIEKTRKRSDARELLNNGATLQLDYITGYAEQAVIEHYKASGWKGIHSENWLWNNLFGLLFWDIIYDVSYGAFNQPLQFAPADLYQPDFYLKRSAAISERLELLDDTSATLGLMREIYATKNGIANPFVNWHESLIPLMDILLNRIAAASLKPVLRHFATDVKLHRRGFPDLFIWRDDDYRFIEVKAAFDQLSPQQFRWLKFFAENGIKACVERASQIEMIALAS